MPSAPHSAIAPIASTSLPQITAVGNCVPGHHLAQAFAPGRQRDRVFRRRAPPAAAAPRAAIASRTPASRSWARSLWAVMPEIIANSAVPEIEQIVGKPDRRRTVVEADAGMPAALVQRPGQHVRQVVRLDHLEHARRMRRAQQHQAVDAAFDQRARRAHLDIGIEFVGRRAAACSRPRPASSAGRGWCWRKSRCRASESPRRWCACAARRARAPRRAPRSPASAPPAAPGSA